MTAVPPQPRPIMNSSRQFSLLISALMTLCMTAFHTFSQAFKWDLTVLLKALLANVAYLRILM